MDVRKREEVSQAGDYRTSEDVSSQTQIKSNDRDDVKMG